MALSSPESLEESVELGEVAAEVDLEQEKRRENGLKQDGLGDIKVDLELDLTGSGNNITTKPCPDIPTTPSSPFFANLIKTFDDCGSNAATLKTHFMENRSYYLQVVLLAVAIVTVCILLALPTVFYFEPSEDESSSDSANINVSRCTSEVYSLTVCKEALLNFQSCLPGRDGSGNVYIPANGNQGQEERDTQITRLLGGVQLTEPSPECKEQLLPFLCLYRYGLCDGNGESHLPSFDQCESITTDVCGRELGTLAIQAAMIGQPDPKPNCDILPVTTLTDCSNGNDGSASGENRTMEGNSSSDSTLVCSDGFYVSTGDFQSCRPECGEWEQEPHASRVAADSLVILSSCIYTIAGSVLLVFSCLRYKNMFSYPSILIVYQTITFGIFEVFVLIGFMARDTLYCSSRDLQESIDDPTSYCKFMGVVFTYTSVQFPIWWVFHVMAMSFAIFFPHHFRNLGAMHRLKYIHIIEVVIGLIVPIIPVVIILETDGYGLPRFPPFTCTPIDPDATYYSLILPSSVFLAVGISLMIVVFWKLIQMYRRRDSDGEKKVASRTSNRINRTQKKLLIILSYYILFGVVGLTSYSVALQARDDNQENLVSYFTCEATGTANDCNKSDIAQPDIEALVVLSLILTGLYPLINLIYVWHTQELKKKFMWWRTDLRGASSSGPRSHASVRSAFRPSLSSIRTPTKVEFPASPITESLDTSTHQLQNRN